MERKKSFDHHSFSKKSRIFVWLPCQQEVQTSSTSFCIITGTAKAATTTRKKSLQVINCWCRRSQKNFFVFCPYSSCSSYSFCFTVYFVVIRKVCWPVCERKVKFSKLRGFVSGMLTITEYKFLCTI